MNATNKTIYTIGYSPHFLDSFLRVIKNHNITAVVDVRSSPYSQFKPEFNKDTLKEFLHNNEIAYVFMGDLCGARVEDQSCYVNGKVDYSLVAESSKFKEGLERIIYGMEKYHIVLMCAEKDPIACHRTILVCRNLASRGINIKHILSNGRIEDHHDSEQRLLKIFGLNHPDLFRSAQQRLNDAYLRQGEKIAYEIADPSSEYKKDT